MLKRLMVLGAALMLLGACDEPRTVALTESGARIVDCQSPIATGGYRRPGPCYDSTNRTRYVTDDTRNITRLTRDDTRNITRYTRYTRDDTTDRSVYCVDVGAVIKAPLFIVYFDFDKSSLTDTALNTIGQAAQAYREKGGARVTATGHTDTAGPDGYNMALSLRRANAVKDQLVHDGVKAEDISVVGLGESSPAVPTGDGVREAQNRRVEIVLR